jgi:endoglucanase
MARFPARALAAAALAAAATAAFPAAAAAADPRGAAPGSPNPLASVPAWFVDSDWHPAWGTYRSWRRTRPADAGQILKIARQPQFRWFGKWETDIERKVRLYLEKVDRLQPGSVPSITIFRHPHPRSTDPNVYGKSHKLRRYSFGAAAYSSYDRWIDAFARGVGGRRVVIAFEPDALGSHIYLTKRDQGRRFRSFRRAIDVLSRLPNATIYLEAGASDWRPAGETARFLRYIGIHKVRGFMLNATHFDWTSSNVAHGLKISQLTGGKPFVISTHANGRGPHHYRKRYRGRRIRVNVWCNPRNSALGSPPTTKTDHPKVDAYLWIGRAGYSAGRCNGGTPAGTWWAERALTLARRTPWTQGPLSLPFGG